MKLIFTLSTSIRSQELGAFRTPMLLIGKLAGQGLGSHYQALDQTLNGIITKAMDARNFSGKLKEYFLVPLQALTGTPDNLLVVGLGNIEKFEPKILTQVIELAVATTVNNGLSKLSVPILPNRQTQGINLRGQAHLIKRAAQLMLEAGVFKNREGDFEIELVCTPQAKTHLQKGLACQRIAPSGKCCDQT